MRLLNFDDPAHREANVLLPWYVNGTLGGSERERVERHVRQCAACQREVGAQRSLAELVRSLGQQAGGAEALPRLHALMNEERLRSTTGSGAPAAGLASRWPFAIIAVQLIALVLLVTGQLVERPHYRTLATATAGAPSGEAVVVVFDDQVTQEDVTQLLRTLRLRMVDGPNSRGAYVLESTPGMQQAVLEALRNHTHVRFAQPAPGSSAARP
jgi:anti-sigma-K factor RskA